MILGSDAAHTAQRAGEQPTASCFGAYALRAPETILQSDFGPGVDVWAVGCLVCLPAYCHVPLGTL